MSAPSTVQWLRTAVHRVAVGSGRRATYLAAWAAHRIRRIWEAARGWLGEGSGFGWLLRAGLLLAAAAILRKVITAAALSIWHRIEDGGAPVVCWGAAAWWIVSAYRAGVDGWEPKRPASPESEAPHEEGALEEAGDEEPDAGQAPAAAPLPGFSQLCESLARIGTPHAHIAALADDLGTTPEQVREALDRCEVPVEPVRMRGRGSSTGIKGDALPTPRHAPETVVAAGHPGNNDNNNTSSEQPEEGLRVEPIGHAGAVVRDPSDAVRHHNVPRH